MALGGPPLVQPSTGEDVTQQELGGSKVHSASRGVGDVEVADDEDVHRRRQGVPLVLAVELRDTAARARASPIRSIAARRRCSTCCPSRSASRTTCTSSSARSSTTATSSTSSRRGRSDHHLPRAHRRAPVGDRRQPAEVARRHPRHRLRRQGRALHPICDAFNVPLVFLQDVPGFMVGSKVEHAGIIRHGAKMLHVMAAATVPKITVVVRKAYGAGYYVMCGRAYEPDLIVAWPSAEISVMGAEGMVGIAVRKPGRGSRRPRGQARRADRGLPQDHRHLHRRRLRPDRRRDRPARHPPDDLPRAGDVRGQEASSGRGSDTEWCPYDYALSSSSTA